MDAFNLCLSPRRLNAINHLKTSLFRHKYHFKLNHFFFWLLYFHRELQLSFLLSTMLFSESTLRILERTIEVVIPIIIRRESVRFRFFVIF